MRIRTDSKLRTKQNTRLVIWNNTLKFENKKQTVILQKKKIEQKALQDTLNDLKRKKPFYISDFLHGLHPQVCF